MPFFHIYKRAVKLASVDHFLSTVGTIFEQTDRYVLHLVEGINHAGKEDHADKGRNADFYGVKGIAQTDRFLPMHKLSWSHQRRISGWFLKVRYAMQQFFRRDALKNYSSSEQLNKMLIITPLWGWMAIFTGIALAVVFVLWGMLGSIPVNYSLDGTFIELGSSVTTYAEHSGSVTAVYVDYNTVINKDDAVCKIVDQEGVEMTITAVAGGLVNHIYISIGSYLNTGAPVLSLRTMDSEPMVAMAVPVNEVSRLSLEQQVFITPVNVDTETYGRMYGKVSSIANSILTEDDLDSGLFGPELIDEIGKKSYVMVSVAVDEYSEDEMQNGFMNPYRWTKPEGNQAVITDLSSVMVTIEGQSDSPFQLLFSSL